MSENFVFIDIDGTLIKGQTQVYYLIYLFKKGKVSFFDIVKAFVWQIKYKYFSSGIDIDFTEKLYKKILVKKKEEDFQNELEEFFNLIIKPKIFPEAKELIENYKKNNKVILLTSMPDILGIFFSKFFKIDLESTRMEKVNEYFTGKVSRSLMRGEEKLLIIQKFKGKGNVTFLSDNESDIPALEASDKAIAVNPTSKLELYAKKRKWKIIKL